MASVVLSPTVVLASPIQVNPQAKTELQTSAPQVAQDAQKVAKAAQTDTVTISPQALKMADDKDFAAKEAANKADEQQSVQLARDKATSIRNESQKNAAKAYAAVSAGR